MSAYCMDCLVHATRERGPDSPLSIKHLPACRAVVVDLAWDVKPIIEQLSWLASISEQEAAKAVIAVCYKGRVAL